MPSTTKILVVYYKHKRGGFCKRIKMKIDAYLEKGWVVHYIAVTPYPYEHANLIPHILATPFSRHEGIMFVSYFFLAAPIYAFLLQARYRFDLISSVSPVYAWICVPAKFFGRAPMATFLLTKPKFSADTHEPYKALGKIEFMLEKTGIKCSDLLIANSNGCRKEWIRQCGNQFERIEVLFNNVEKADFNRREKREILLREFSLARDSFVVATSGILEPHKNIATLIKSLSKDVDPRVAILILGDGVQRPELTRLAESLQLSDRIIFAGWREDALSLLQGADLYVHPSFREGMSEALLEAGSCHIPWLVSAIPENTEVITNPEQQFPPENVEVLADKIKRSVEDREFYKEILAGTENDIDRYVFNWKKTLTDKLETLLTKNK
ncbi:MAG: glycosyltransferase family 4 protein [Nitrospinae bacterium]|nr:glycosyltransferase family 4 protein [Nitrospinota bacterium]